MAAVKQELEADIQHNLEWRKDRDARITDLKQQLAEAQAKLEAEVTRHNAEAVGQRAEYDSVVAMLNRVINEQQATIAEVEVARDLNRSHLLSEEELTAGLREELAKDQATIQRLTEEKEAVSRGTSDALRAIAQRHSNAVRDLQQRIDALAGALTLTTAWMRWWIENNGCDCEPAGHHCGLPARRRELAQAEQALAPVADQHKETT